MNYEITTSVEGGKLKRNINLIQDAIRSFEGKQITIKIEKFKRKRSNPQNAYLWGVVIPIMQQALKDSGHIMTKERTHELLKLRFLKESILVNEETGECVDRIKSSTELSTSQMMDYFSEIRQFAIEYFGANIPEPNENITFNFDL